MTATPHNTACRRAGLTLVEMILAVAILGFGFTVLLTAASRCLGVMKAAKNYQSAQWVLGMGELEYPLVPTNDVRELEVEPHEYLQGFIYSRTVEDDEDEDGLYVVRTRISWSARGNQVNEEVVRYVYIPPKEGEVRP